MARQRVIRVNGKLYRYVRSIDEGQTLYFMAGREIVVERFDMRPGGCEFDFQINSRPGRGPIAAMRSGLDKEFDEPRVKSNFFGVPIRPSDAIAMAQARRVTMTYGEIAPKVYRSKVMTSPVGWTIWFKRTYYAGSASLPFVKPTGGTGAYNVGRVGVASIRGQSSTAPENDLPLTNNAGLLFVYVGVDDFYEQVPPFQGDMTGQDQSVFDKLNSYLLGWRR